MIHNSKFINMVLILILFVSCSSGFSNNKKIYIKGSDTMYLLVQRLAAEYMHLNPEISIYVSGGGTASGFDAINSGNADICMASRDLKAEEVQELAENHSKLGMSYLIAKDALSIYLNPMNQITDITLDQLKDIFQGKINNWEDLDGRDMKMIPVIRPTNSGTHEYFKHFVLKDEPYYEDAIVRNTTKQVIEEIIDNEGAIGYGGIAFRGFVFHAKINGVAPTEENVKNDTYPIIRYLHLYTVEVPESYIKEFINWTMSEEAQKIIEEFGYISLW